MPPFGLQLVGQSAAPGRHLSVPGRSPRSQCSRISMPALRRPMASACGRRRRQTPADATGGGDAVVINSRLAAAFGAALKRAKSALCELGISLCAFASWFGFTQRRNEKCQTRKARIFLDTIYYL